MDDDSIKLERADMDRLCALILDLREENRSLKKEINELRKDIAELGKTIAMQNYPYL